MDTDFTLIDPFGGKQDLEAQVLRHVSPSFSEDPLRVLRVARFMARFGADWSIASETMALMQEMVSAGTLDDLSRERVWVEIEKGLMEPHPELMLGVLTKLGVFHRAAFAEYAGALQANFQMVQVAAADKQDLAVRFALAFPRLWSPSELKDSRIPKHIRDVSHCLTLGLSKGLGSFDTLSPEQKVEVLSTLDAFRQRGRMLGIVNALRCTHPDQIWLILQAISAVDGLNRHRIIAGSTDGVTIRTRLTQASIEAVAAVGS